MVSKVNQEITELKEAINALQGQRETLGDAVVEALIQASEKQLAELEGLFDSHHQQRKLATILFTDVVGSTHLGQHLEPDEVLEVMDGALKRLAIPVETHGGHVTRFQGDGFKAVFGVPLAQENDPEQAVRAGLEILKVAREIAIELETKIGVKGFLVRVGVNTGLVAVGGETEAQDTIMGRAVNLAARMESAAPPGGLLISHFTYLHVRGIFDVDVLPPIQAKGFDEPVAVYLVNRSKPRTLWVSNRGVEGVETRLVGRQSELINLQDALLNAVEEEEGQFITVSGEAGVGKSRLLFELQKWIELLPTEVQLFQGQAKLESQHIPYGLIRDLFTRHLQIQDSDPPQVAKKKIEQGVQKALIDSPPSPGKASSSFIAPGEKLQNDGFHYKERAHLIGHLLGFGFDDSPYLQGLLQDPQALHYRALISLREYFKATSQQLPVVIFLEDIHWADDSSLDAIKDLGRITAEYPLVLVCLARPILYERRPYWGEGQDYHRRLDLKPLSKRESRQLVEEILRNMKQISSDLRDMVVQSTEGNPFYIEELIKMLIEQGVIVRSDISPDRMSSWSVMSDQLAQVQVPSTLTGVLQARLDSLQSDERRIIQQASVIGRVFWDQALAYVHENSIKQVDLKQIGEILKRLRDKEMVFRREDSVIDGTQEYIFKNDVLREVTYDTVLIKDRKVYHGLVADWLLTKSHARVGEYYGLVAKHLEFAARIEEASNYFTLAGDQALDNYANLEAQGFYLRALDLNPSHQLAVKILTAIGRSYARQGLYQKAKEYWQQGVDICREQNDLHGLVRLYTLAIRTANPHFNHDAMEFSQQAMTLVPKLEESSSTAHLLHQIGRTYHFNGLYDQALEYCQSALSMGERLGDTSVQADTLTTIGILPDKSGEQAIQVLTRAERLAESQQLYYILGRVRNNLATIALTNTGDYQSALVHSLGSAEAQRLRGDIDYELAALNLAAVIKLYLGDLTGGRVLIEHIQSRLDENPGLDMVRTSLLRWSGLYKVMVGDWADALEDVWQAYELIKLTNNNQQIFDFLVSSILPVLLEVDRFYQKQNWTEVETVVIQLVDRPGELNNSSACSWMSAVYASQDRLEEAEQWLVKAKQQLRENSPIFNRWVYGRAEVALAMAKSDWEKATQALERFINFMDKLNNRWEVARAWMDWGDVCVARASEGDFDKAREKYSQSLDLFTDMGANGFIRLVQERLDNL
jgi:class 3 adenylate cyclase/tetratricopeptide (TPR) repeat protein